MLGGGFQMYISQNCDGSARRNRSKRIREVGDFVHARRMLFEKKPIADVGIFYSADSYYRKSNIFNAAGATNALIGTINAVLDAQYSANVILEYQLDTLKNYKIVIVPEWEFISDEVKEKLLNYAKDGGKLLVIGAEASNQFGKMLSKDFGEIKEYKQAYMLDEDGGFSGITDFVLNKRPAKILDIKSGNDMLYSTSDLRDAFIPSYRIDKLEKGEIAFIPFDFATDYFNARSYIHRNFIKKILLSLNRPTIEINRTTIDISMQEDGDSIFVNLLNMNQGRHSLETLIYDEIPPIYDVEIKINKPYTEVSMPLGEEFFAETTIDSTIIKLKKLDIHSVIKLKA